MIDKWKTQNQISIKANLEDEGILLESIRAISQLLICLTGSVSHRHEWLASLLIIRPPLLLCLFRAGETAEGHREDKV